MKTQHSTIFDSCKHSNKLLLCVFLFARCWVRGILNESCPIKVTKGMHLISGGDSADNSVSLGLGKLEKSSSGRLEA